MAEGKEKTALREITIIPTYKRPEMLFYCMTLIRHFEPTMPIAIFPDHGTIGEIQELLQSFDPRITQAMMVPDHGYYGNSYNTMEAFRWAYNCGADRIFYVEDDVMVHWDFFKWHREMHEEFGDVIFSSMAWVFNHYAPITEDPMFQPWYYSVGTCFSRNKLSLIAQHATPFYYEDMPGYIEKEFPDSPLSAGTMNVAHFEQDGLIQRILDRDKTQTVSSGMARCTHLGSFGYNKGWEQRDDFYGDAKTFEERVQKISEFIGDPYWRAELFGRPIVEREIGKILPPRLIKYRLKLGEFECNYESELKIDQLPRRLRSVPRTPEMEIVVTS
jgi:hypothetical protein